MTDQLPTTPPPPVVPVVAPVPAGVVPPTGVGQAVAQHPSFTPLSIIVGIYVVLFAASFVVPDSDSGAGFFFVSGLVMAVIAAVWSIIAINRAVTTKQTIVRIFVFIASLASGWMLLMLGFFGAIIMGLSSGPPIHGD